MVFVLVGTLLLFASRLFADDDDNVPSLADVHKILLQAAGYEADTPPTPDQQKQLLGDALKMLRKIPHVYHGQLNLARRDIEAALSELSTGDAAHKARSDIFDADDIIKGLI
jgi:hypothetical protein